jgi:hypothetical protein
MKNLVYIFSSFILLTSCGALRVNKVTSESSRFERYYEASKRCFSFKSTVTVHLDEHKARISVSEGLVGLLSVETDEFGQEHRHACVITPGCGMDSRTDCDGILRPTGEDPYEYFEKVFINEGCFVVGERDLNKKIQEKKDAEINIWANLFKPNTPRAP